MYDFKSMHVLPLQCVLGDIIRMELYADITVLAFSLSLRYQHTSYTCTPSFVIDTHVHIHVV